jgi:hypothetical protein
MKRFYAIIPILILMALVKYPIESSILEDRKKFKSDTGRLTLELRQQMPQLMAVALLGGFRGVVCDFIWITAHGSWERQEWFKMKQYFNMVVTLQPMSVHYWETAAWHMAWNISYSVSQDPKEPRAAKREQARRHWIEEGRKFLERGVENVPERYNLYFQLGWLIMQKQDYINADPEHGYPGKHFVEAADWFKKAWLQFPEEAPTYIGRMVGHCYMKAADAPGVTADMQRERWQQARDWWCALWQEDHAARPDQMWYKIEEWGRECEAKLGLPPEQHCFPPRA